MFHVKQSLIKKWCLSLCMKKVLLNRRMFHVKQCAYRILFIIQFFTSTMYSRRGEFGIVPRETLKRLPVSSIMTVPTDGGCFVL